MNFKNTKCHAILALPTAVILNLSGCASNPYSEFFRSTLDTTGINPLHETFPVPAIYKGDVPKIDNKSMAENGYTQIGYSSFHGYKVDADLAREFGEEISAHSILIYSKYDKTISGVNTFVLPDNKTISVTSTGQSDENGTIYGNTSIYNYRSNTKYSGSATATIYGTKTTYIPYSVDLYDQLATFWVPNRRIIFGAYFRELTQEEKMKKESNRGVAIDVLIKKSPAYNADFLTGDIITKIDSIEIVDLDHIQSVLKSYQGKSIEISALRNFSPINKSLKLNAMPPLKVEVY